MIIVDKSVYGKIISALSSLVIGASDISHPASDISVYYYLFITISVFKITVRKHEYVNSLPFETYRIPVKCNLLKTHRAENEIVAARIIKLVAH